MKRKDTSAHRFWHRVVDGQIRSCMQAHPEYLNPKANPEVVVNSIAKRVVGEIVARDVPRPDVGRSGHARRSGA